MKKAGNFLIVICFISNLFAIDGLLSKSENLRIVKTQYFDIIFPEECRESAKILVENADKAYEELAATYEQPMLFRFPVVITPEEQMFNAYFSTGYYNRIVMYATTPDEDFNEFSEIFLSTFKHELTHAFTFNLRDKFWQVYSIMFGDNPTPTMIAITSGMAEGATVSYESKDGEGRINNEYTKHLLRQAKIEDDFPSYADVSCVAEKDPNANFYEFNGFFHDWLQKNYGMKKYGEWWYRQVNIQSLTVGGAFKKVYGFKLKDAWNQFAQEFEIPEICDDSVENGKIQDLFAPDSNVYSKENSSGNYFYFLTNTQKGIYFYKRGYIYFIDKNDLENSEIQAKKICSVSNVSNIRFSNDGNFAVITYYDLNAPTTKRKISIYDIQNKKNIRINKDAIKDGNLIKKDGEYYLVYTDFSSFNVKIKVDKVDFSNKKNLLTNVSEKVLNTEVNAYSYVDVGGGNFAFINKSKMDYSICVFDSECNLVKEYSLPLEKMDIRYLSFMNDNLYFSWANPGTMIRFGKIDLAKDIISLSNQNISGGIFYPVGLNQNEIAYIANFAKEYRLLKKQIQPETMQEFSVETIAMNNDDFSNEERTLPLELAGEREYKKYEHLKRGVLLPLGTVVSNSFGENGSSQIDLPIGISYITSNPWGGTAFYGSVGYGRGTNSVGINLGVQGGADNTFFRYVIDNVTEFDKKGWKSASLALGLSSEISVLKKSAFAISNNTYGFIGKENNVNAKNSFGAYAPLTNDKYLYLENSTSFVYRWQESTGYSRYAKKGFAIGPSFLYQYLSKVTPVKKEYLNASRLGMQGLIMIPRLFPIKCKTGLTYNLPTTIRLNVLSPSATNYSIDSPGLVFGFFKDSAAFELASFEAQTVLFSSEIQKSIFGTSGLYLNYWTISFVYFGEFECFPEKNRSSYSITNIPYFVDLVKQNDVFYNDYGAVRFAFAFTPAIGGLANPSNKIEMYLDLSLSGFDSTILPQLKFGIKMN